MRNIAQFDFRAARRLYGVDPTRAMLDAMAEHGISISESILCDGELHRFMPDGDRRKNGWYVCYPDHGAFGNWRTGVQGSWSNSRNIPPHEKREIQYQIQMARQERQRVQETSHRRTGRRARVAWANAQPVDQHPYLTTKKVRSHGLKQDGHALLVPMRIGDKLWNLQRIFPDGAKRFLKHGRVAGCYCAIGQPQDRIYIAEGYATAASIFEATGHAVACAFDAGNLPKVARKLTQCRPDLNLVIAADHDEAGIKKAIDAMHSGCASHMIYPPIEGMDWNDYHQKFGIEQTQTELLR